MGGAATPPGSAQNNLSPCLCHRRLYREQKRGRQTWQAETGTTPKTQQGEQRLPGEPEEQALYVNLPSWEHGLPTPAWVYGGEMGGRAMSAGHAP